MKRQHIELNIPQMDDEVFYNKYYGQTLEKCERHNIEPEITDKELEIYITSFDGLLYAKYQIKMLRALLIGVDYNIVFADTNSHINPAISAQTKQLCIDEGVCYVKIPHNKFQDLNLFSDKLGVDMTWIWRNCVKLRQPKYFGYLDQDCFALKPIWGYLKPYLDEKGMYGVAWPGINDEVKNEYWLVHIMQNFFKYDFVKDIDLDFRPNGHLGLDTSGCNYHLLFKNHNREDYLQNEFLLSDIVGLEWGDVFRDYTLHDDCRWVHIRNSTKKFTNHPDEKKFKEVYMTGMLNGILLNNNTSFLPPE